MPDPPRKPPYPGQPAAPAQAPVQGQPAAPAQAPVQGQPAAPAQPAVQGQGQNKDLRKDAIDTLTECDGRLKTFREDAGMALNNHLERTFTWLQNILAKDSKPTDWFKDGVALAIRCYGTGKEICEATHKLYTPSED